MADNIRDRLASAVVDRYTIERELGGGGMSRVFVALEQALGRRVVIKTLPEDATFGNAAAERFRREILTAARIEHANIVPVLAAGDIEGTPYFVMPWVDGDSLRQQLQRGRVPLSQAISILRDVARALAAAHAHGVVHRDIKPENILLSGGAARVTDFGVAKALSAATQGDASNATNVGMTGLGMSIGTPAYMAPEQLAADPALDHRADIYAWGLVAYELLGGAYPFAGLSGAGLMQAQLSTNPPALTTRDPNIPVAVSALVAQTLSKDPAQRPQSAGELIQALDNTTLSSGESNRGAAGGAKSSSRKWGAFIAIGIIGVGAAFGAWKINHAVIATNEKVIAVAPFKVSGAVETVHYLREGVADLMVPQLSSIDSMHPISSRQMFDAWRRAAKSMDVDLDESEAFKAAAKIGAGQLILGTIAGTAQSLVISATLKRVRNGATLASDTVQGVADSAVAMTARLTSKLLLLSDGANKERVRTVMQAKPAAITSFLNGERFYRSGRYLEALKQFRESYAADLTFPLVPLRIYSTNGWVLSEAIDGPWIQRALNYRSHLTGADSLLLEAYTDPNYPAGTPPVQNMERMWNIALKANSAEVWYVAADAYLHSGAGVGVTDAMDRALKGFKRAEAIDSTYVGGIEHQSMLYLLLGDTANARAADQRQARIDSTGDYYAVSHAHVRMVLSKPSEIPALAHDLSLKPARLLASTGGWLYTLSTIFSLPPIMAVTDSALASQRLLSELRPGTQEYAFVQDAFYNTGRIAEGARMAAKDTSRVGVARSLLATMYWDGDSVAGQRAAARIAEWRKAGRDTSGTVANALPRLALALWSLDRGDSATARQVLEEFRAYHAPATNRSLGYPVAIYGQLLEAGIAAKNRSPNAKQLIARLDSAIITTPNLSRRDVRTVANLVAAGLWEEVDEPQNALAASLRRDMQFASPVFGSTFLRLRANALEKLGRKEEAIRALQSYVDIRARADAALQPDVQAARNRIKALEKKS